MNRRGFFQTLLAGIAVLFLPKNKKAESEDEGVVVYDNMGLFFEPHGSSVGDYYYDTEKQNFYVYDGETWIPGTKENQYG